MESGHFFATHIVHDGPLRTGPWPIPGGSLRQQPPNPQRTAEGRRNFMTRPLFGSAEAVTLTSRQLPTVVPEANATLPLGVR